MSYYEPLTRFLETRREGEITLTFQELEDIIDRRLPDSARKHQAWWANTTSHSHADAWLRLDWKTSKVDIVAERVVFARSRSNPKPTGMPDRPQSGATPVVVDLNQFSLVAKRLVEDYTAEMGGDLAAAIARATHEAAIARRGRLLDEIVARAPRMPSGGPSNVDLIREDRDAR